MGSAAATVSPSELVLGRYRPLRPLGSGGSGSVWLARDEGSGLEVALKAVPREGKAGARAEREASVAARLRHARCLRAYAFGTDEHHAYIAYEYAPGRTLREAIRAGRVDDRTAVEVAAQMLEGLAHAHARKIVHRDVKPSNVLLVDGDAVSVRLLDFGLAQVDEAETLTAAGDVPGTLAYIAPERLEGKPAGPAADVWATGVVLWEALAGVHPFWTSSVLDTARAIERGAPSLALARPDLPRGLIAAVDRSLSPEPGRRPTAANLARALRTAFATRERGRRRGGTGGGPRPARPGRDTLLSAGLAALVAGVGAAALPFYPDGWAPAIAAVTGLAGLVRPRAGLALALAAPVLPLGNLSLGLAVLYAAVAAAWLLLAWWEPKTALLFAVGPLLAPLGALGLMPLAALPARSAQRRAALAGLGVLAAALVAGLRDVPLPLTAGEPPAVDLAGADSPLAVAGELWRALSTTPGLLLAAVALGAAAALVPVARARGPWAVAGLGAGLLAVTLLPSPAVAALPLVAATWTMCVALALTGDT